MQEDSKFQKSLFKKIQAAQGKVCCDLVLKNAVFLNVFTGLFKKGHLSILDGTLVGVKDLLPSKSTIDLKGKKVIPGFIDAHVHIESSLMTPFAFEKAVLKKGTTTAVCDPHELANVKGISGIQYFLDAAQKLKMDLWVLLSSCVPATNLETNGAGVLSAKDLSRFETHPRVLGLAEMMNVPAVLNGEKSVLEKIERFSHKALDGHAPLVRGKALSAYAVAGIQNCHESTALAEAQEKLLCGLSVWIREGSVAKDLDALIPLLKESTWPFLGFCTDDRNPWDIEKEGHIDALVRRSLQKGFPSELVFQMASWSVAAHYGLHRGPNRIGAIAPGFQADLIVLEEEKQLIFEDVFKKGVTVGSIAFQEEGRHEFENTVFFHLPEEEALRGVSGRVHVIEVIEGKILTEHSILDSAISGVEKLVVQERHARAMPPAVGYVRGFGVLKGAIGSSVAHDSHNLIVVGSDNASIRTALACLKELGGGFVVTQGESVCTFLALPFGGLMSQEQEQVLSKKISQLKKASQSIGCVLKEPFLQLAFLSLPVIPKLKLTDHGLIDVETFSKISVCAD